MAIPQIPDWRERILFGVGAKPTSENLRFFDAWARAEGGGAENNPFNTTQRSSGSIGNYNNLGSGIGVQRYGSAQAGVDATVNTLTNGRYGNIIGALRAGDSAMMAANALAASPWGTGGLVQKILGGSAGSYTAVADTAPNTQGYTPGTAPAMTEQPYTGQPSGLGTLPYNPDTPLANRLGSLMSPAATGSAEPQAQEQASPSARLQQRFSDIQRQNVISPASVALLANLGTASQLVAKARRDTDAALYGESLDNEPVSRTLSTLQTGSTESQYKTLDLGQDFDGPLHPNVNPVVAMAQQYLGTPYLYGGADPRKGFDCSGFVQYLYAQAGVALGRTTYDQVKQGEAIREPKDLMPGDVVFFSKNGDISHEGLYIGGGQFIHAPHTGDTVKISSLSEPYYASNFEVGRRFMTAPEQPPAGGYSPVPKSGGPRAGLAEAFYDPLGSYDSGAFGGPIGNHDDHVHISASEPGEMLKAIGAAQNLGLHVGENPYVGDNPESGIHTKTSFHYRTFPGLFGGRRLGQGIDVSGDPDKMAQFYRFMTGT